MLSLVRGGWDPLSLFGDSVVGALVYAHHFSKSGIALQLNLHCNWQKEFIKWI